MNNYLSNLFYNSFAAISPRYYFRHFLIGLIFPAIYMLMPIINTQLNLLSYILFSINCLLYPYARYVYQTLVLFILGNRDIIDNTPLSLFINLITMALCWSLAIFIAPIGLLYLYLKNKQRP